ncbi:FAD-binding oxidoreductase [Aspergillus tanneri]|uniref:FAD-binding PCMH-type domain-containing protein n=2 Tax=Aspergillus tanneri TaxID=1220188 RepID=A0A5M9MI44_9EURO|nr:uncharacterized protein ATNIH1004_005336 [Aspergillus tanneri]KAA8646661.1 hypothetical protein ATNIH1004_005336 [Aspergillus tanneri]
MSAWAVLLLYFFTISNVLCYGPDLSGLRGLLSQDASVAYDRLGAPRWSEFPAPDAGAVVNAATEDDVLVTVRYCIEQNIPFLAQNGGHGSSITFTLDKSGVIINLEQLNHVRVNAAGTELWLEAGALVSDVVAAAFARNTTVPTPTCNCIGQLGAGLGAGYGNLVGAYGLIIDNLLSVNIVTPAGDRLEVSRESDSELWFAIRGAGPNFGIVTSATMRAYPVNKSGLSAWLATLTFSEKKIEDLVQAMNTLILHPEMAINLIFAASESGNNISFSIMANLFYYGTDSAGREAFSTIYAAGPETDDAGVLSYDHWNDPQDGGCAKGQRKQRYGAGLARMVPATWRELFQEYKTFVRQTGAVKSAVIMNGNPIRESTDVVDSAYPFRSTIKFNTWVQPSIVDSSLDAVAREWGLKSRDLLRSTSGLTKNCTYINGAYGDEDLSVVYGDNVQRLRKLKAQMDPHGRFNEWFPLS